MTDKSKKLEKRAQREQERAAKRRQRYLYIFTAIATLMILITGVVLWQVYGPRETPIETIALAAGECTPAQAMMNYGRGDLQEGAQLPTYVDYPPLSGAHLNSPLRDGVWRQPAQNDELSRAVHSLEHGRVIVYYNQLTDAERTELENLVGSEGKVIVLPWTGLKDRVVLAAWARWQRCHGVNPQAILNFINSYRDKGPEGAP
ncbi:MAG: DUF3105 domain-containing protein [Anaerolineae bacterium]|nr:DUF3105 domain-containing protein [Anaerolineae bacterium]